VRLNPGISGLENFRDPGIRESRDPGIAITKQDNAQIHFTTMQIFFVVNDHMTANSVNVILLLEIFTKTYTNIYKYWNYLLVFSFVHN